jgi:hypothetical protein
LKLQLAQEGHYSLSREDETRCLSVDTLLAQAHWANESGSSMNTTWQSIIRAQKREVRVAAAVKKAVADLKARGIVDPFQPD